MSSAIQPALPTTAGGWLLGVLAALAIKLSTSVDDVAWLLPFVANSTRSANMQALQYIATNFSWPVLRAVLHWVVVQPSPK